ncbi:MAG TPA: hypothetical protein VLX92_24945 [Kofleriaceae bacterium]|nr:hypothetical protein [Kofleriaceae bacterium]
MVRYLPLLAPLGVAVVAAVEWHDLASCSLALELVGGMFGLGLVLAVAAAVRAGALVFRFRYALCSVIAALTFVRVAVEIVWQGAHTVLDADALRDLGQLWFSLAIGVLCLIAAVVLARIEPRGGGAGH